MKKSTFNKNKSVQNGSSLISFVCALLSIILAPLLSNAQQSQEYTHQGNTFFSYSVPQSGWYLLEAKGAQGGPAGSHTGGKGASMQCLYYLNQGQLLRVSVGGEGQAGTNDDNNVSGGGGGGASSVTIVNIVAGMPSTFTPLLIAGGGGGAGSDGNGNHGYLGNYGATAGSGGSGGNGGTGGGGGLGGADTRGGAGGAGFYGDGGSHYTSNGNTLLSYGGQAYTSGNNGGNSGSIGGNGGWGGGGEGGPADGSGISQSDGGGAGGGGYSGGGGGSSQNGGGGGSSFIASGASTFGCSQSVDNNTGNGWVKISGPWTDSDGDGYFDPLDNCPSIANIDQADADGDKVGDVCDQCPTNPFKTSSNACGCNTQDADENANGIVDCQEGLFSFQGQSSIAEFGFQYYHVPATGWYLLEAIGAQGGPAGSHQGGRGARMRGMILLQANDSLRIAVGQAGMAGQNDGNNVSGGGGGGASSIVQVAGGTYRPLVIAGGGGGAGPDYDGDTGLTTRDGGNSAGVGGTSGGGGNVGSDERGGAGGAGFFCDGGTHHDNGNGSVLSRGGYAYMHTLNTSSANTGGHYSSFGGAGGWGGGGQGGPADGSGTNQTDGGGGGGGGYCGGGGANKANGGGGGSSFIADGANINGIVQLSDYNSGNGKVTIKGPFQDTDQDAVFDPVDNCPTTANFDQKDSDNDGTGDVCDVCPNDPMKALTAGTCGCFRADIDVDSNGVLDCNGGLFGYYGHGFQLYTIPVTGWYSLEAWGAKGGDCPDVNLGDRQEGARGAYAITYKYFTAGTILRIGVGEEGADGVVNPTDNTKFGGGGGGGASSITIPVGSGIFEPILFAGGGGGGPVTEHEPSHRSVLMEFLESFPSYPSDDQSEMFTMLNGSGGKTWNHNFSGAGGGGFAYDGESKYDHYLFRSRYDTLTSKGGQAYLSGNNGGVTDYCGGIGGWGGGGEGGSYQFGGGGGGYNGGGGGGYHTSVSVVDIFYPLFSIPGYHYSESGKSFSTDESVGFKEEERAGFDGNGRVKITPVQDTDGDGFPDEVDNCPFIANAGQEDKDHDGVGDICDGCPENHWKTSPGICGCSTDDADVNANGITDCQEGIFNNYPTQFQQYRVPVTGWYLFDVSGAQGGPAGSHIGGNGARMQSRFYLEANDTLSISVGEMGDPGIHPCEDCGVEIKYDSIGYFEEVFYPTIEFSGCPTNRWSGAGGGGATSIQNGHKQLLIIAAGGGGAGSDGDGIGGWQYPDANGGNDPGRSGQGGGIGQINKDGHGLNTPLIGDFNGSVGGAGGGGYYTWGISHHDKDYNAVSVGGMPFVDQVFWGGKSPYPGGNGGFGGGGQGGTYACGYLNIADAINSDGGGGGGGGWSGGGGGSSSEGGGGGGSLSNAVCRGPNADGFRSGHGTAIITGPLRQVDSVQSHLPYTWSANGVTYTHSGHYTYNDSANCITRVLEFTYTGTLGGCQGITGNDTTVISCGPYLWAADSLTYSQSGTYYSVIGCRSDTLQLTVIPRPPAPTGLACYETATFNDQTCQWDITGTPLTASAVVTSSIACFGGTAVVTVSAVGGNAPYYGTGAQPTAPGTWSFTVSDDNGCTAATNAVTVTEPSKVQGSTGSTPSLCGNPNGTVIVTASGGSGTYSYLWSNGQTTATASGLVPGNYTVTVTDANGCTSTSAAAVSQTGSSTGAAGPISGPAGACRNTTLTYSIAPVANANSYSWSLPAGATGSSAGVSITVSFNNTYNGGFICVTPQGTCGSGAQSCINVPYLAVKPNAPGNISGPANPCGPGTYTYSVNPVYGATSYTWSVTGTLASITGGQGTNAVQISTASGMASTQISVSASNCKGTSTAVSRTLYGSVIVSSPLTGTVYPCAGSTMNYSVDNVAGAVTYAWTVTGNATVISSNGTSCTVSFANNWSGGTLNLFVTNSCGTTTRSYVLYSGAMQPGGITGAAYSLCPSGGTNNTTFSISPVTGAASYLWTVPSGMRITGGGTSTTLNVSISNNYTSGDVCVSAVNACGQGTPRCLYTSSKPAPPAAVSGPANVCKSQSSVGYTIAPVAGATSYTWGISNGCSISGTGTTGTANFSSANVTAVIVGVVANNQCGTGNPARLAVSVNIGCRINGESDQDDNDFVVYPNPNDGRFTVFTPSLEQDAVLEVYSMDGRKVGSWIIPAHTTQQQIDLDSAAPGIYQLRYSYGIEAKCLKVVVE